MESYWIKYSNKITEATNSSYADDLSEQTKAKIGEFADSIGVTVATSLTKAKMIEKIVATQEFVDYEVSRKNKIISDWIMQGVDGV